jgi:hypothetical protein
MVSFYPCEIHGTRYRTALRSIRITLLEDRVRYTRRLRVCPPCLGQLLAAHADDWQKVTEDSALAGPAMCLSPDHEGQKVKPSGSAFVYVWPGGDERDEYFSEYCAIHAELLISSFGLIPEPSS